MVHKKQTRAKKREKQTLHSSARTTFVDSQLEDKEPRYASDALILPAKKKKRNTERDEIEIREEKAKLSTRQKKRILTLIERKILCWRSKRDNIERL